MLDIVKPEERMDKSFVRSLVYSSSCKQCSTACSAHTPNLFSFIIRQHSNTLRQEYEYELYVHIELLRSSQSYLQLMHLYGSHRINEGPKKDLYAPPYLAILVLDPLICKSSCT